MFIYGILSEDIVGDIVALTWTFSVNGPFD